MERDVHIGKCFSREDVYSALMIMEHLHDGFRFIIRDEGDDATYDVTFSGKNYVLTPYAGMDNMCGSNTPYNGILVTTEDEPNVNIEEFENILRETISDYMRIHDTIEPVFEVTFEKPENVVLSAIEKMRKDRVLNIVETEGVLGYQSSGMWRRYILATYADNPIAILISFAEQDNDKTTLKISPRFSIADYAAFMSLEKFNPEEERAYQQEVITKFAGELEKYANKKPKTWVKVFKNLFGQ